MADPRTGVDGRRKQRGNETCVRHRMDLHETLSRSLFHGHSMILQSIARRLGYVVLRYSRWEELERLANYKPSENVFAEHLRQVFRHHEIGTVLDVGANDGAYAAMLRRDVGFEGVIHSFEPIPEKARMLRSKASRDGRWEVHEFALGARPGRMKLNLMSSDVFSSFLAPFDGQPQKYRDSNRVASVVEVEVKTVAEVLETLGLAKIHLKMDTQGFDQEVFAGALPALSRIATLQSELSFRRLYEGAPMWDAAVARFGAAGFKPSFLLPISLDSDLGCIETDGVFVRGEAGA